MTTDQQETHVSAGNEKMPAVGFGTWKKSATETARVVKDALEIGYRLIDSAADYGNEVETGKGIAASIAAGHCTREDLWVTSKLWNTFHRKEHVRPACEKTLRDLGLDYLDLYLVHFPIAMRYVDFEDRYPPGWLFDPEAVVPKIEFDLVPLAETWQAMEALVADGLVQQIGVSNYNSALLSDLMAYSSIKPSVLQIESHPLLTQESLIRLATQYDIAITAFSPLGAQSYIALGSATGADTALSATPVVEAAARTGKTAAQVVLRWGVQRGTAIIPSSTNPDHLRDNLALFDFALSNDEMAAISALNQNRRFNDPAIFCEKVFGTFCTIYD